MEALKQERLGISQESTPILGRTESIDDLLKSKHGQKMDASEAATLTLMGLNPVLFGLPGGAALPLDEKTAQYAPLLKYLLVKHEAQAVKAASGYGALTGVPAFSLVTSGPGVVNAMTGVYDGQMEMFPSVTLSGNVALSLLRNKKLRSFQGSNAVEGARAFAKNAYLVEDPDKIQEIIIHAFHEAMQLPQGSILVDVPKQDIAMKETTFWYFDAPSYHVPVQGNLDMRVLLELSKALNSAERPFVVLGRGAFNARYEVWKLIEERALPFGYTLKGKGVLPDDHPQNYGMIGQHGKRSVNEALYQSDFVLIIGANGDDRAFQVPSKINKGKKAVINPYTTNVAERLPIDYLISADAGLAISELNRLTINPGQHQILRNWNVMISEKIDKETTYNKQRGDAISPVDLMEEVNRQFSPEILVLDVGEHQMHGAKLVQLKSGLYKDRKIYGNTSGAEMHRYNKRVLTSGTAGTMATSIEYATGAQFADPNAKILNIIGNGGLEMHVSALWLLAANHLDIPVVLMNNQSYGQVFEWLKNYHRERTEHAATSIVRDGPDGPKVIPDFGGAAIMYNLPFIRAMRRSELPQKLSEFSRIKGARLFEGIVYNMGAYPVMPPGGTVQETIERPLG